MSEKKKRLKYPGDWIRRKQEGEKISVMTCYDYTFARLIAASTVDAILVGDSLGMVIQGRNSTTGVSVDDIIYHGRAVRKGAPDQFLILDMPLGSYQASPKEAVDHAVRMISETEANGLKLEGSSEIVLESMQRIIEAGIPVMGHTGLTPQSFRNMGGYRVQGRTDEQKEHLIQDARTYDRIGCFGILLELVTADTAAEITKSTELPTIGIGAGKDCSGQVLVLQDILGLDADFSPKHTKKYMDLSGPVKDALNQYDSEVKSGDFPAQSNSFFS